MTHLNNKFAAVFAASLVAGAFFMANPASAVAPAQVGSWFKDIFNQTRIVAESGSIAQSGDPYWWVNSGGYFHIADNRGWTVQGDLISTDPWKLLYAVNNPTDTDLGLHPQNIFRLLTRSNNWKNFQQSAYFKITADNLSLSPNRNASNGLLLMNRYVNGDNLYYAGVRRDGAAVIKKKLKGSYTTLVLTPNIFPGTYNQLTSPNLLPKNTWIGLKTEVMTQANGSVSIRLLMDKNWTGTWTEIARAVDTGKNGGTVSSGGSGGIRTDFMDVMFDNYAIQAL